jgi:DNA-binding CsgD family transcriptional regulator
MSETMDIDLSMVIYNMPGLCFWKNRDFQYLGANQEALNSMGFACVENILGKRDDEMPWFKDAALYQAQDKLALKGHYQFNVNTLLRNDGTRSVHFIKKGPLRSSGGEILGIIVMGFRLTQRNYANIFSLLAPIGFHWVDFTTIIAKKIDLRFSYENIVFSRREAQIISGLLNGNTAIVTANKLYLSKKTVESHLEKIRNKLECKSKLEIVSKAFEFGFIDLMFKNIL